MIESFKDDWLKRARWRARLEEEHREKAKQFYKILVAAENDPELKQMINELFTFYSLKS